MSTQRSRRAEKASTREPTRLTRTESAAPAWHTVVLGGTNSQRAQRSLLSVTSRLEATPRMGTAPAVEVCSAWAAAGEDVAAAAGAADGMSTVAKPISSATDADAPLLVIA